MHRVSAALLFTIALTCTPLITQAHEIHVSPDGPIKTLTEARDAIRTWHAGEGKDKAEPIRVIIADGTYPITEPVTFEPQDTGTSSSPIIYEAAPGAKPIISGGRRITGWKQEQNGLWSAEIPEVKSGQWYFQELWINGRRATRARTPNKRYLHASKPALESRAGAPPMKAPENTAFYAKSEDLKAL